VLRICCLCCYLKDSIFAMVFSEVNSYTIIIAIWFKVLINVRKRMIRISSIIRPLMSETMINDTLEHRRIGGVSVAGKLLLSICTQAKNNNLCFPSQPMLIKVGICSCSMFRLVHKTSKNRKTVSNCRNWNFFWVTASVAEGKTLKRIVAYLNLIAFCNLNEERTGIGYPKILWW